MFCYGVFLGVIRWKDFYHFNIVIYNEDYNVNIGNKCWMSQLCTHLLSTMWQLMLHHWLAESQAVFWQGKLSAVPQKPYCQPSEKMIKDGYCYHTYRNTGTGIVQYIYEWFKLLQFCVHIIKNFSNKWKFKVIAGLANNNVYGVDKVATKSLSRSTHTQKIVFKCQHHSHLC